MAGKEERGANFIKGAPVGGQRGDGCICMSRVRAYEHVYCNTDTERAKLARVKATVSIPPPSYAPEYARENASARIVALSHCTLQKYFITTSSLWL